MILIRNVRYLSPSTNWMMRCGDIEVVGTDDGEIAGFREHSGERPDMEIDGSGKILLPAFVNAHIHVPMILFRGLLESMILEDWLHRARALEMLLTPDLVKASAMAAMVEMIRSGTSGFLSSHHNPDIILTSARKAGLRVKSGITISDSEECLGLSLKDAERLVRSDGDYWFAPHSMYSCSIETLQEVMNLAEEYSTGVTMHMSETRSEVTRCWRLHKMWPVEYLDSQNLLSPRLYLSNTSWITKDEVAIIATANVHVVHCPASSMKLASGATMPVYELINAGVGVHLGTDSPASNNTLDMRIEMKFASLLHKAHRWDASVMPHEQILSMAISPLPGWGYDIVMAPANQIGLMPFHSLANNLVHSSWHVSDLIVDGRPVMLENEIVTLDETRVISRFADAVDRFRRKVE